MTATDYGRDVHYRPAGWTTVCGIMKELFDELARDPGSKINWRCVKATTDVSRVTCEYCVAWIQSALEQIRERNKQD